MREIVINRTMQHLAYNMVGMNPTDPVSKDLIVSVGGSMRHIAMLIVEYQHVNSGDQLPKFPNNFRLAVTAEVLNTLTDDQLVRVFEIVVHKTYTQR